MSRWTCWCASCVPPEDSNINCSVSRRRQAYGEYNWIPVLLLLLRWNYGWNSWNYEHDPLWRQTILVILGPIVLGWPGSRLFVAAGHRMDWMMIGQLVWWRWRGAVRSLCSLLSFTLVKWPEKERTGIFSVFLLLSQFVGCPTFSPSSLDDNNTISVKEGRWLGPGLYLKTFRGRVQIVLSGGSLDFEDKLIRSLNGGISVIL